MSKRVQRLALVGVPVLVIAAALAFWLQGGRHMSTENAFVKADIAQIASEVPGRIVELRIHDHSTVAAGDVLRAPRTCDLSTGGRQGRRRGRTRRALRSSR